MCDSDSYVNVDNTQVKNKVKHFEDNVLFNPSNKGKVIYILFKADWCGACQNFKPFFYSYRDACKRANKKDMIMVVIDNETSPELFQEYGVNSMPTTFVYKIDDKLLNNRDNKLEILNKGKIVGSDRNKFSQLVKDLNNL